MTIKVSDGAAVGPTTARQKRPSLRAVDLHRHPSQGGPVWTEASDYVDRAKQRILDILGEDYAVVH